MEQMLIDKKKFEKLETQMLTQVAELSKSVLETFKFKMFYWMHVSKKNEQETKKALAEFRKNNWDQKKPRDEAYKEYLDIY